MALFVPTAAKVEWLKRALYANAGGENGTLKLFSNNVTPSEGDTAGTYTEATFTGYAAKTLTSSQAGGTWAVPSVSGNNAVSAYGTSLVWNPTSSQTVYGYFLVGASSGTIWGAEAFGAGKPLNSSDTLTITLTLNDHD